MPDDLVNDPVNRTSPDDGPSLPDAEPPVEEGDTRPRAPVSATVSERLAAEEPPIDPMADTAQSVAEPDRPAARPLLLAVVMAGTLCICITLVGLASFAGYRDGLATNDARITQTMATGIFEQYATGAADLASGNAEMAAIRLEWIVETVRPPASYMGDSPQLLATARAINAFTATPQPTLTPTVTETPLPTVTFTPAPSATVDSSGGATDAADPDALYDQAQMAMRVANYEDAISWLDALQSIAPDYRVSEVRPMLSEALTQQGLIYVRGANADGEDKLQRGVTLIYRAQDLGPVEPSGALYEAQVAERFINARSYVSGGNYAAAIPVLEQLCAESEATCNWGYRGVSVRDLLEQARAAQNNS